MIDCQFEKVNGYWKCSLCNWVYPLKSDRPPHRNCPGAPSRGLGDTIAKFTKVLGIKKCRGCKKRQKLLNKLFPYKVK